MQAALPLGSPGHALVFPAPLQLLGPYQQHLVALGPASAAVTWAEQAPPLQRLPVRTVRTVSLIAALLLRLLYPWHLPGRDLSAEAACPT